MTAHVTNPRQLAEQVLTLAFTGHTPQIRAVASYQFVVLLHEIRFVRPELYHEIAMLAVDMYLHRSLIHKQPDRITLVSK